jgi:hypothetical protein
MKHGEKTVACVLCSLAVCGEIGTAFAVSQDNPYQTVVERNVFCLKPAPPPAPDPSSIKPPAPPVKLTGIFELRGIKHALMKTTPPGTKPGDASKEQSYILSEGEREGDLEVLKINEIAGIVTVNEFGTVTNITFDTNVTHTASAPAPGGPAGGGLRPNGAIPPPSMPGMRSIPPRALRLPSRNGEAVAAATSAASGMPALGGAIGASPSQGQTITPQADPQGQQMSGEAAAAMIEAERELTKQAVLDGKAAPIPITPFTPPGSVGEYADPETMPTTGESGTPRLHHPNL